MIAASIDIGTNTVLLLVARVDEAGTITTMQYEQRIPRLGRGVDTHRRLHPQSMARVVEVLAEYKGLMSRHSPDCIVVTGTSAVRDAENRAEFAEMIRDRTGLRLEVLSGADEAIWTYRGALSGIPAPGRAAVVDIGGGSTEITIGEREYITESTSIDIGSVRLTERFFRHDPPTPHERNQAESHVRESLLPLTRSESGTTFVAVAGTATTLALLDQERADFDVNAVTNYVLTLGRIEALYERLQTMSSSDIRRLSHVMEGRSDVITAGALILRAIMQWAGSNAAMVSERGLRYGIVLREWERRRGAGSSDP
jgi:exopolyphosphatase/guanosine-5'-triphosphate,3'-diphosphate pyrophosphatase